MTFNQLKVNVYILYNMNLNFIKITNICNSLYNASIFIVLPILIKLCANICKKVNILYTPGLFWAYIYALL